jgi:hypothetical protein
MMALDMTVQLAPMVWGMLGLLIVSAAGIITIALPRTQASPRRVDRPTPALRPASLPA